MLTHAGRFCYIGRAIARKGDLQRLARILKLNHIGIATDATSSALDFFGAGLGLPDGGSEWDPQDQVKVRFLPVGESRIELLEPVGDEGPIQKFLQNRGPGIHHICLEVDDLPGMLAHLKQRGVRLIDSEPRPGAHGTLVAFIHPKSTSGVLIELVQTRHGDTHDAV